MTAKLLLLLIALLVPPKHQTHNGETEEAARARYDVIAQAIHSVAGEDHVLAAFLVTVARHESTFRRDIHSGEVRGDGGWSWSLYQLNLGPRSDSVVPGTKWRARDIVGVELAPTRRATHSAAIHLRKAIKVCHGEPLCVFKRYGGVSKTMAKDKKVAERLRARVKTYRRVQWERKRRTDEDS